MANGRVLPVKTRETHQFLNGLSILVVDCDSTSLTIASMMLRAYGYDVVAVNEAIDALCILREREEELDLILTEVNLPDTEKFELLETMGEMSSLPIVVFSGDDSESTMLGSLFKGAVQYILKPMTRSDVKNLWQFSYMKRRRTMASIEGTNKFLGESSEDEALECQSVSDTLENHAQKRKTNELEEMDRLEEEAKHNLTVQKKPKLIWTSGIQQGRIKRSDKDEDESKYNMRVLKKPKLIWTTELHDIFLQAIETLGIDDAHPKQILRHMNVPGLRKENIASHLQKYRLSLKREQDAIQKNTVGDYDHLLATNLHRQHYQLPFIMKACSSEFGSHFRTDVNASLYPSLGSRHVAYNEGSHHSNNAAIFWYGQLAPESNQLYSNYVAFSPVESKVTGKLKNLGQMGNHNAQDFLQQRTACPDVGKFGSESASNFPTIVDNSLNHETQHWQHRFLLQQTSAQLPPPAHQVQLGHNWCETERGEIHKLFDMAEMVPQTVPGQQP